MISFDPRHFFLFTLQACGPINVILHENTVLPDHLKRVKCCSIILIPATQLICCRVNFVAAKSIFLLWNRPKKPLKCYITSSIPLKCVSRYSATVKTQRCLSTSIFPEIMSIKMVAPESRSKINKNIYSFETNKYHDYFS